MCLFPRLIINKKYKVTKKNKGDIPTLLDNRVKYVPIGCGNCIECRKQIANSWRVRLMEEIKVHKYKYFITLTYSNESLKELIIKYNTDDLNEIATKSIRLFLERYRKYYKKALRHWLITELGQTKTERLHIHGIIFTKFPITNEWLEKLWKYGNSDTGLYVNERTVNYIIKYVTKIDIKHKDYKPKILCSKGIGKNYINNYTKEYHKYKQNNTKEDYIFNNGNKINMPIYYRNKLYSDEEREKLWIEKINKDTRYINGIKIENASKNIEKVIKKLQAAQQTNFEIGFGTFNGEWSKKDYKIKLNELKNKKNNKIIW